MLYSDVFIRDKLVELTRDPTSTEARLWIGVALSSQSDSRGVKLLKEAFDQCLLLGESIYALWGILAIKEHAPLENIQPFFTRFAMDQADREQEFEDTRITNGSKESDDEEISELITSLEGEDLKSQAYALAMDWSVYDIARPTQKVTPLLSAFNEVILTQLLNVLELKCFQEGDLVIEEGEESGGVYWICSGAVDITRRNQDKETINLATLGSGALVGEMGLITRSPRVATVTAIEPVHALILPAKAYAMMDESREVVHNALSHLVGKRMLQNITKFSPVFKAIPPEGHPELLSQFKAKVVPAGEILLRQGKPGRGLFLILDGLVEVTSLGSLQPKWLREGDIFGEISLVYDSPVSATCTTARRSLLYMLKPDKFKALVSRYPEIKHTLAELSLFRNLDGLYTMA
jgi:CRP-like cAMP-binding protein